MKSEHLTLRPLYRDPSSSKGRKQHGKVPSSKRDGHATHVMCRKKDVSMHVRPDPLSAAPDKMICTLENRFIKNL